MDGSIPGPVSVDPVRLRPGRSWHAPPWLRRLSLKWRLLALLGLGMLPALLFAGLDASNARQIRASEARRHLQDVVTTTALRHREIFTSAERNLRLLGFAFRFLADDPLRCKAAVDFVARQNTDRYSNVAVLRTDGGIVCAAAALPPERAAERSAIMSEALRDGLTIGTIREVEPGVPAIPMAIAIRDPYDGRPIGVVGLTLNAGWLLELVERRALPPKGFVALQDASGTLFSPTARPAALPDTETLRRSSGTEAVILRGKPGAEPHTFIVAPLHAGRLYVVAGFPDRNIDSAIDFGAFADLRTEAFILLLAFATVWLGTAILVLRPLRRLTTAVLGQDPNRRDFAYDAWNEPREVAELATAFAGYVANEHEYRRRMESLVEQRDLLMRELHHRVKNNLQLVMNLLSMQERRCGDETIRRQLSQARGRIGTMALLHRQLYMQGDAALVELKRYFEDLLRSLNSIGPGSAPQLIVTIPRLRVAADLAIPLGLILTEAVTNAMKHAFAERPDGRIDVTLRVHPDGTAATLEVADNGIGMADDSAVRRTMGSTLLRALAEQIGGTLRIVGKGGTRVTLAFPLGDTGHSIKAAEPSAP